MAGHYDSALVSQLVAVLDAAAGAAVAGAAYPLSLTLFHSALFLSALLIPPSSTVSACLFAVATKANLILCCQIGWLIVASSSISFSHSLSLSLSLSPHLLTCPSIRSCLAVRVRCFCCVHRKTTAVRSISFEYSV